ncbi:hypothetical protein [Hippea maritima]|uniref:Uncharacterized protein n=1 Tax=Hippea maritima (strain ATCC 700847 / DSM 10411 / MH2) TaxID=760142 RepID=F2LXX6_HIPMA|nr:hypothetical protein [Hippea maritima]AEA33241.1 hypothetical protein Hipma_0264 [Hippea maritima DSM 10411]
MTNYFLSFLLNLAYAASVIREGYKPHVSIIDRIVLGIFTFGLVFAVLFVRHKVSKELKKRGIKGEPFKRRKKADKR